MMPKTETGSDGLERWQDKGQRVARRMRVPLGFVTAGVFLVFARPRARTVLLSLPVVVGGLALRGYAAGYVKKNAELTQTGPYAYTRNPLYLGSMAMAFGFAVAAARRGLGVMLVGLFVTIYWPTILSEERYLRQRFPEFEAYADLVPRLLPRLTPASADVASDGGLLQAGRFSPQRYRHHREYNSFMGAGALYALLLLRLWRTSRAADMAERKV